jgi:cell division protein FtsZ
VTVIAAGFDSGTPTHKKLDPTMVSSRSTTVAPAQSGQVHPPSTSQSHATRPEPPPAQEPPQVQQHTQPAYNTPPAAPQHQTQPPANASTTHQTAPPPRQATASYSSPMGNASVPPAPAVRPRNPSTGGSLPSRAVPVTDEPDDEVDVPPFMRR